MATYDDLIAAAGQSEAGMDALTAAVANEPDGVVDSGMVVYVFLPGSDVLTVLHPKPSSAEVPERQRTESEERMFTVQGGPVHEVSASDSGHGRSHGRG